MVYTLGLHAKDISPSLSLCLKPYHMNFIELQGLRKTHMLSQEENWWTPTDVSGWVFYMISYTEQIPKRSLNTETCLPHHCHHRAWRGAWHRWVISKYFPKADSEQIQNSLLKMVNVLKTMSCQEQPNDPTELIRTLSQYLAQSIC